MKSYFVTLVLVEGENTNIACKSIIWLLKFYHILFRLAFFSMQVNKDNLKVALNILERI